MTAESDDPQLVENWFEDEGVGKALEPITRPGEGSVEGHRETTRSALARWLMALLTITVLIIFAFAGLQMAGEFTTTVITIPDLTLITLTPVVTLAGTALGFYFGAQTASGDVGVSVPKPRDPGLIRKIWRKIW